MQTFERYKERFFKTLIRTVVTTIVFSIVLVFAHLFPGYGLTKPVLFGAVWLLVFCIVFGGHWLEVLFINYVKFLLPANLPLLYFFRIVYWFLCAIPLFLLANWVFHLIAAQGFIQSAWWLPGLGYIGIELFMHAMMQLRFKKSFYNGVY